jgi:hypothetical protein
MKGSSKGKGNAHACSCFCVVKTSDNWFAVHVVGLVLKFSVDHLLVTFHVLYLQIDVGVCSLLWNELFVIYCAK